MLAYPLALLYIFEWLGYQEVPLPMKRDAPAAYMQFADPAPTSCIAARDAGPGDDRVAARSSAPGSACR